MAARVFNPVLMLLARLTDPELARAIQYLKAENEILRSRFKRVRVTPAERRRLLRLGLPLGRAIRHLITIVTYQTFRRWVRDDRSGKTMGRRRPGRPRTPREIRQLIVRLARENDWGYTRIIGELKKLGIRRLSRSTVRNILRAHGLDPGPRRGEGTWDEFVKMHLSTLWACDFFTKEVWTVFGKVHYYVLFFIHIGTRRVHIAGITAHPDGLWTAQQARNMCMLFQDEEKKPSYILRDGDKKFTPQFDAILRTEGTEVKRLPWKSPNLNAYAEAWVGILKRECLNRFVAFGEHHLRHIIEQYVAYYNSVRPHQGIGNVTIGAGKMPPPESISERGGVVCESRLGGLLRHYRRRAA